MSYKITFVVAISIFIITGFAGVASAATGTNCVGILCTGPWLSGGGGSGEETCGFMCRLFGGGNATNPTDSSGGGGGTAAAGANDNPVIVNDGVNSASTAVPPPCDKTLLPSGSAPTAAIEKSAVDRFLNLFRPSGGVSGIQIPSTKPKPQPPGPTITPYGDDGGYGTSPYMPTIQPYIPSGGNIRDCPSGFDCGNLPSPY